MSPAYLADRRLTEDFACLIAETLGDKCLAAVCLPWSTGAAPAGAICPALTNGVLDLAQVESAIEGKEIVIIGCTFKFREEEAVAAKVVQQLSGFQDKCIVAAHLLAPGELVKESYDRVMSLHRNIHRLDVDDVLLDPEWNGPWLKVRMKMLLQSWSINRERMEDMLSEEPEPPPAEEIKALEARQHQLLWEDIPRELLPRLRTMPSNMQETDAAVDSYALGMNIETSNNSIVRIGHDSQNRKVVVKVTCKCDVFTPEEVEHMYREYCFLSYYTQHTNIVHALDCFHAPLNAYTVLEFAGRQNLAQYLSDFPGLRMKEDETLSAFSQIVAAVTHCHDKDISHRSISLEHIVMKPQAEGDPIPKLLDFRDAMIAKEGVTSTTVCGRLPCMSPEMLWGSAYLPKMADCWSVGILLLEMAGGKGSFFQALEMDEDLATSLPEQLTEQKQLSERILDHFATPGAHEAALACMGGFQNTEIHMKLDGLLQSVENRDALTPFGSVEEGDTSVDVEPAQS